MKLSNSELRTLQKELEGDNSMANVHAAVTREIERGLWVPILDIDKELIERMGYILPDNEVLWEIATLVTFGLDIEERVTDACKLLGLQEKTGDTTDV